MVAQQRAELKNAKAVLEKAEVTRNQQFLLVEIAVRKRILKEEAFERAVSYEAYTSALLSNLIQKIQIKQQAQVALGLLPAHRYGYSGYQ